MQSASYGTVRPAERHRDREGGSKRRLDGGTRVAVAAPLRPRTAGQRCAGKLVPPPLRSTTGADTRPAQTRRPGSRRECVTGVSTRSGQLAAAGTFSPSCHREFT